jgi:hypothetical protein
MPAVQGKAAWMYRELFEVKLATATERMDYAGIDPDELARGRDLEPTRHGGCSFRRYIIDGREYQVGDHEALSGGRDRQV